uniref:NADH-ubiquinone oxidoreductase chain 5 n=1 Tax=Pseudoniphargus carpalis TaxID=2211484 RepID=A0A345K5Q8_9CRUS|nr:NADH dehydrogenase subunit 5 [Pseudoniphargus carpalis]AXH38200.1 NADH dehydrogenase subunit 5 [Pseudoniphargus carpalis]
MKLGTGIYKVFTLLLIFFSLVMFMFSFLSVYYNKSVFLEWEIFYHSSSSFVMSFIFDWMSLMFLGAVTFISGCIMKYSYYYMEGEVNFLRFVMVLLLFVGSMMALIVSPNLISLLLGWDGLGLSSYILVVFYQNESSANAGMLTVLSNRVGDVMILMSVGLLSGLGSWNYYMFDKVEVGLVVLMILLAGMTKSAQMPFSAWLPAAMAAPTPVSSLVHSSTLVTAGVYLLIRFYPVMSSVYNLWVGLMVISVLTMVSAGLGANFETDIKKVVALSTLSQLGLMMMILSVGLVKLSFFHLITHAMFKSSLFMCVGFMMHNSSGNQDGRNMSSFNQMSPLMVSYFLIVNMALMGFPFLAGFYSKDLILESMLMTESSYMIIAFLILGTGFTFSYSVRMMFIVSGGVNTGPGVVNIGDMDKSVSSSVVGLVMASLVVGFICSWVCFSGIDAMLLFGWEKYSISMVGILSGAGMYMIMSSDSWFKSKFMGVNMISNMMYLPEISADFTSKPFVYLGAGFDKLLDKGWLEFYGGKGGEVVMSSWSNKLQLSQSSIMVSSYLISVACMLGMFLTIF